MINVIPLFSVLNDDFKAEGGMIYPILNADYSDALGVGYVRPPFVIVFTDEN